MSPSLRKNFNYLFLAIATLLLLLAIAIGLLPSILKWGIHDWFEQQQLNSHIEDIEIQLFDGRLTINNLTVRQGRRQKLKLESLVVRIDPRALLNRNIVVQQFSMEGFDLFLDQKKDKSLTLAGIPLPVSSVKQTSNAVPTATPWHLKIQDIDLAMLRGCYRSNSVDTQEICASLNRIKWDGQLKLDLQSSSEDLLNSLQANVSLILQGLEVKDTAHNTTLAAIEQMGLHNIQLQGLNTIRIETINLNDLAALQRPLDPDDATMNYVLNGGPLNANDVVILNLDKVSINDIKAHGLNLVLQRDPDGKLQATELANRYQDMFAAALPADKTKPKPDATPINFKLGQLSLLDNSSLRIIDKAVKPVSRIDLNELQLLLQKIDTEKTNGQSPLKVDFRLGQHGLVQLQGNVMLFAERTTLTLDGQLKGINLSDFNVYTQQAIQHYVKSGHLDADTSVTIEQGQLNSTTKMTLHKFYVAPATDEDANQYQQQLGLPLGTALSLLRDRDDSITLKLPISGDIKAPDFSLNDIIAKVSSKAIKTAVVNYYSPLGVLNLAGTLFDLATALRFDPIMFDVSMATLDEDDRTQLDKLALILRERPQLHLVICGISTQADRLAWFPDLFESSIDDEGEAVSTLPALSEKQQQRLDALAVQRSLVVQDYLIKQKLIDASQLILCTPKHMPGDTQPPRVELQF